MQNNSISGLNVLLLEDDSDLRQFLYEEIGFAGFSVTEMHSASQVLSSLKQFSNLILVSDYDLGESITGSVLVEILLHVGVSLRGVVLMSGHPNFIEQTSSVKTLCAQKKIPFYALEKPVGRGVIQTKVKEISQQIIQMSFQSSFTDSDAPMASVSYLHSNAIGYLMTNARQTIGVTAEDIVDSLKHQGCVVTVEEYKQYETNANVAEQMQASVWAKVCSILELSSDVFSSGYNYKRHLRRLKVAIQLKEIKLPYSDHLRFQLRLIDEAKDDSVEIGA